MNVDEIATFNVGRLDGMSPDSEITNAGTLNVQLSAVSGGKLTNTGAMTVEGTASFTGTLANSGTFKADGDTTLSGSMRRLKKRRAFIRI